MVMVMQSVASGSSLVVDGRCYLALLYASALVLILFKLVDLLAHGMELRLSCFEEVV